MKIISQFKNVLTLCLKFTKIIKKNVISMLANYFYYITKKRKKTHII